MPGPEIIFSVSLSFYSLPIFAFLSCFKKREKGEKKLLWTGKLEQLKSGEERKKIYATCWLIRFDMIFMTWFSAVHQSSKKTLCQLRNQPACLTAHLFLWNQLGGGEGVSAMYVRMYACTVSQLLQEWRMRSSMSVCSILLKVVSFFLFLFFFFSCLLSLPLHTSYLFFSFQLVIQRL